MEDSEIVEGLPVGRVGGEGGFVAHFGEVGVSKLNVKISHVVPDIGEDELVGCGVEGSLEAGEEEIELSTLEAA